MPHVERIDGMDMWVIEGQDLRQGRVRRHRRPRRQEAPVPRLAGRRVGHRRRAPGGVGPGGAAAADGRARHRCAGALSELDRPRRAEPLRTPSTTSALRQPLHRALQRRHGRDAGAVGQPAAADADHAGLGHRRVRPRGPALRRDGHARRQHDRRPAGLRLAGPRRPPAWDPFWEVCAGLDLPVHFHIGASQTSLTYFGTTYWPSQDDYVKPAIGGASLFQNNSRLLLNSAYSGMFDRHPGAADGLRRERHRLGAVHARGDGLRARGERARARPTS